MKVYLCGKCGQEFNPEPYYYGGDRLCSSCRENSSESIHRAKEAYDGMSFQDRKEEGDFASAVSESFPKPSELSYCNDCNRRINDGETLCSSCRDKREIEYERSAERAREAREEYRRRINDLG